MDNTKTEQLYRVQYALKNELTGQIQHFDEAWQARREVTEKDVLAHWQKLLDTFTWNVAIKMNTPTITPLSARDTKKPIVRLES